MTWADKQIVSIKERINALAAKQTFSVDDLGELCRLRDALTHWLHVVSLRAQCVSHGYAREKTCGVCKVLKFYEEEGVMG